MTSFKGEGRISKGVQKHRTENRQAPGKRDEKVKKEGNVTDKQRKGTLSKEQSFAERISR
jgi:hypothetical protein